MLIGPGSSGAGSLHGSGSDLAPCNLWVLVLFGIDLYQPCKVQADLGPTHVILIRGERKRGLSEASQEANVCQGPGDRSINGLHSETRTVTLDRKGQDPTREIHVILRFDIGCG